MLQCTRLILKNKNVLHRLQLSKSIFLRWNIIWSINFNKQICYKKLPLAVLNGKLCFVPWKNLFSHYLKILPWQEKTGVFPQCYGASSRHKKSRLIPHCPMSGLKFQSDNPNPNQLSRTNAAMPMRYTCSILQWGRGAVTEATSQ